MLKFVPTSDPFVLRLTKANAKKDDLKDAIQTVKKALNGEIDDIAKVVDVLTKKDLEVDMFTHLYEMCMRGEDVKEHVRNEILKHKKDNEKKIQCFREFLSLI